MISIEAEELKMVSPVKKKNRERNAGFATGVNSHNISCRVGNQSNPLRSLAYADTC